VAIIVSIFGVLIVLVGVVGIANPQRLLRAVEYLDGPQRFWLAVIVRVVLGSVLLVAAPECRLPTVVRIIGVIAIAAALAILLLGRARLDRFIAWWLNRTALIRFSGIVALPFGILVIYAGA
jgi:hypothetical protein